ncbi:MAG TPA: MFS transporter [Alphaproteobacteria bacterium]|nr:MFS transporter [Alphaproteobacteria bacterium]
MRRTEKRRLFYGWVVVAGAFTSFAVSAGVMHSFTVFFVAFLEEFGWSRADTSVAYSVAQLISGASAPLIGVLVDRLGPRLLVLLGGIILAVGLAANAYVTSLWQLILLYGLVMTLGANCLGLLVSAPLVSRWFVRKRGMAIAIVQSANGFGRATSTPLVQLLISAVGWRVAYLVLAVFMAVLIVPLMRLFQIREPGDMGLLPDGIVPSRTQGASTSTPSFRGGVRQAPPHDWSLWEAMKTLHLWLLFGVYAFTGLGSFFVSLHQLAFAVDLGFDKLYAASVLGMGSFLTIGGIISIGTISDYIGREIAAILAYLISIIGVTCALFLVSPQQTWLLWLHACFFGVTWGARGPLITAKTADLFQGKHLGAIFGVISIGTGLGAAAGSWASGWIFDLTGSYRLAFVLSIASYLGGCVTFWRLRRPPKR